MSCASTQQSETDFFCSIKLFNHVFEVKTWCLFCTGIECDYTLLLKIVAFNTVLMVLKIVTLLYNGHLCFFNRFEVTNTTRVIMYTSYIVHRSCFLMFLTWFYLEPGMGTDFEKKKFVLWDRRFQFIPTLLKSRLNAITCNWYVPIKSPALAA